MRYQHRCARAGHPLAARRQGASRQAIRTGRHMLPNTNDRSSSPTARLALILIMAAGAVLRLYHLETPSMWWDEILVPLTSSHGLSYILDFCRSAEMHPPLYYFFTKAAMSVGADDFSLRLPAAALGLASIYLVYSLVRTRLDEDSALLAAAFLAVNGLHLFLSREVRPYALQLALLLIAFRLLLSLASTGRWRDMAGLLAVNAAMFWLHYFTFHIVFAQGVALALCWASRVAPIDTKRLAAFCAATVILAAPVLLWFFMPSTGSRSIFADTQYSRWDVFALIRDYLGMASFFFEPAWARIAAGLLALAGFVALARRDPALSLFCALIVLVPLVNVLALGKAAYFSPWHLAYATPFLALCMALAVKRLGGGKILAVLIAFSGAVYILCAQYSRYYETGSYKHNVFVTLFKPVAKRLTTLVPRHGVVVSSNPGFANGVNWYLDRFTSPNPLRNQTLDNSANSAELRFISAHGDFGVLARDEASFLAKTGKPSSVEKAVNATVYTFPLKRQPVTRMDALPFETTLAAGLHDFYGRVHTLANITYCPMPGVGVTPTKNGVPGVFEFAIDNAAQPGPVTLFLNLQFANTGRGNMLALFAVFDSEPPVPVAGSLGPDPRRQMQAVIAREKPFARLTLRAELTCADKTAKYHGGNLETLAFGRLELFACSPADAAPCQSVWERRNMESLRLNYSSEAFRAKSATPHKPAFDQASNLRSTPSHEIPGWTVLSPQSPDAPAVLDVEITPNSETVFYPRLSGPEAAVLVFEQKPDGSRTPVFMMAGVPEEWTPISAQYPLVLPAGPEKRSLRVELRGRFCQLWAKDGRIFF
jgi:hypothetical protein